ncbi:MAG: M24 family metallopeptidase [Gammaproteobacteria bacterium]|nr:MAG: M24 family metallopeptidase [Gammaproteobacteria bacterium]
MPATIPKSDYKRRRAALMNMMDEESVAVVPAASPKIRNRDSEYLFRQDSDFHYLTGFSEPEAVLVLAPGRAHGEVILFCRDREPRAELYDGERLGPDRAAQIVGVDDAFPVADLDDILPGMLEGRGRIYFGMGDHPEFENRLLGWIGALRARESGGARPPEELFALKHLLHEQRLIKTAAEVRAMRRAAEITCEGHVRAMRACQPGMTETQLEAELIYAFMRGGAKSPAYSSIVGGGANACVLHYVDNNATLKKNDLVLIDAGCEYELYASDVTRTFPVSGTFSPVQRSLYDIVISANEAAIEACRPGALFTDPHQVALEIMIDGLLSLGLLEGDRDEVLETESYRNFCPHGSSHWLGLDVHDVGDQRVDGEPRPLEPGMVLTIEPGIYIPDNEMMAGVPAKFRGIGIRVEDDVLITPAGHEVLTDGAPKSVQDIEATMAQAL